MKFICLGYFNEARWTAMPESQRNALMDECIAYDDVLRESGAFAGGEALQSPTTAVTVQSRNGEALVTQGPYAETHEVLGGILVLEARDLNHAIQLMSKHPGVKLGPFEIRPAHDMTETIRESRQRRAASHTPGADN